MMFKIYEKKFDKKQNRKTKPYADIPKKGQNSFLKAVCYCKTIVKFLRNFVSRLE